MKTKIYISGPISGANETAERRFNDWEVILSNSKQEAVNPFKLNHDHDKSWLNYMRVDIKALVDCHAIYMLEGWEASKGACIEFEIAKTLGMDLYFEE